MGWDAAAGRWPPVLARGTFAPGETVEFRILGAFEVEIDGRAVPLDAAKPRALLALLLLHANEPVASDRLIEELWAGRPPKTARKTLQTYVSQLRRALGDVIRTRPGGYELRVEPGALDLARFERLVVEARESAARSAANDLREALALWRGPPLADFTYEPWAQAVIPRLQQLRLTALEERIEADLALGRDAELVGELEALIAEHPLQERLRGQLMLALYRSGRQAEALAVYRDARRVLVEELGIEPSPALQDLERAILKHEPELEARRGERPAKPPSASVRADALPRQTTSFVGRTRELEALQILVQRPDVRLLTLVGPGGAGKTRLAVELARRVAGDLRDGACFVDLSPVREAALVAGAIADGLGLGEVARLGGVEALGSYLSDRNQLIVLDNFEQVLDAAQLAEELLGSATAVKLLVTSRAPLRLAAEHVFAVPSLGLPAAGSDLESVATTEAVALFLERAQGARRGFSLTKANAATVAELCTRLDGLPLALELAAARVALLSPRAILSRLGHWLDVLKSSAPDVPERHRTLRAAIEWSYDLLRPEEQTLFTNLGVFVGSFTVDGAEFVSPGLDALDGVETLLAASLLRAEAAVADEPRFGMLETIREYAVGRLDERPDAREVRRRHAAFYAALGEEAEPALCDGRQGEWLERLDAELGNLRAALAWSTDEGDHDVGLRLGASLWRFWQVRGHVVEGRESLERLLSKRSGSQAARAAAQLSAARCAMVQGDFEALDRYLEASLPVHRKLGDDRSVGFALGISGLAVHARGDRERALPLLEEALETARRSGDSWGESRALCYLGMSEVKSDPTAARRLLEEGLRGLREIGDVRSVGWVLAILAGIALGAGDTGRARLRLDEALGLHRELGDTWGIADQLESLGLMSLEAGDHAAARELLEESLTVARDAHYRPLMAASLESLARLAFARGQLGRAASLFGSASVLRDGVAVHPMQGARASQDHHVDAVRIAFGDDRFADAWAQGRALTLDEAVAYALDESPAEPRG